MDVRLTADGGDIDLTNGSLSLVTGQDAIAQHVAARLRTWQLESPYNRGAGMPWLQLADQPVEALVYFAEREIVNTPGVVELVDRVAVQLDPATRVATCTARVRTITGEVVSFSADLPTEGT